MHESDYWEESSFVTMTYNDDHMPANGSLSKDELQRFFKRLRKRLAESGRRMKYFASGEYGDQTVRPHYHAVMFGIGDADLSLIEDEWDLGFVYMGSVSYDSARYVADYVQKKLVDGMESLYDGRLPEFSLKSNGLGRRYVEDNWFRLQDDLCFTLRGVRMSLPRYYVKVLKEGMDLNEREQFETRCLALSLSMKVEEVEELKKAVGFDKLLWAERQSAHRRQAERNIDARLALHRKGRL